MENYYVMSTMPGTVGVADNSQLGSMTSQVAYNPIGEIRLIMEKQTKKEECYKKPNHVL